MEGASGTLYEGEKFQLQFKFSPKYPFDSPEVSRTQYASKAKLVLLGREPGVLYIIFIRLGLMHPALKFLAGNFPRHNSGNGRKRRRCTFLLSRSIEGL